MLRYHTKWYVDYYQKNPDKKKKGDVVEREDGLHLSLQKKREILLNNIYGVDIDTQAVEVAQLSLYLKLLQDETPGSAREHQLEFHETLLPSLNKNIVCGNSLIGTDILDGQLFASDEERKLNPMNYEDAFPHIFKRKSWSELKETAASPLEFDWPEIPPGSVNYSDQKQPKQAPKAKLPPEFHGGFDAIVGNPPYVRIQRIAEKESKYLFSRYRWPTSKMDLSLVFLERALRLVQPRGLVGFICTSQWMAADYGKKIRAELARGFLHQLIDFGSLPVFQNASTYPAILILSPTPAKNWQRKRLLHGKA